LLDSPVRRASKIVDVDQLVADPLTVVVMAVAILALVLALAVLAVALRLRRLGRRLDGLTRGETGASLERVLDAHLDTVARARRDVDELEERAAALESALRRSFQRVGLVRYNPFEDTGGNQSFALALLDGNADGIVVSSLHARAGTRVYAKALSGGRADGPLSDEESEALRRALGATGAGAARA
jgi:hypothetical protein